MMYSGDEFYDDDVTSGQAAVTEEREPCPHCGDTEVVEISDERQTILVCATCGSDEP